MHLGNWLNRLGFINFNTSNLNWWKVKHWHPHIQYPWRSKKTNSYHKKEKCINNIGKFFFILCLQKQTWPPTERQVFLILRCAFKHSPLFCPTHFNQILFFLYGFAFSLSLSLSLPKSTLFANHIYPVAHTIDNIIRLKSHIIYDYHWIDDFVSFALIVLHRLSTQIL